MEFEPINLTTFVTAFLSGIAGILLAWSQLRKYAIAAVEQAERDEPDSCRSLIEAMEGRLNEQEAINDLQAEQIEELQAKLRRDRREIEELQARFARALEALADYAKALLPHDPKHAGVLQERYADIVRGRDT